MKSRFVTLKAENSLTKVFLNLNWCTLRSQIWSWSSNLIHWMQKSKILIRSNINFIQSVFQIKTPYPKLRMECIFYSFLFQFQLNNFFVVFTCKFIWLLILSLLSKIAVFYRMTFKHIFSFNQHCNVLITLRY